MKTAAKVHPKTQIRTFEPQCGYAICVGLTDRGPALTEICFISKAAVDDMNAWIILLCHNEGMPICVMPSVISSSSQLVKSKETAIESFHCMFYCPIEQKCAAGCCITQMTQLKQTLTSPTTPIPSPASDCPQHHCSVTHTQTHKTPDVSPQL